MTSGGLGTMGYGLPAAIGVQIAHPMRWSSTSPAKPRADEHAGDVAPRCSTACRQGLHPQQPVDGHGAPVAGTAAWRRYSESYSEALPDFVKLAEAYACRTR
jgi:acetolactate synthase-1/2/3 large subunit